MDRTNHSRFHVSKSSEPSHFNDSFDPGIPVIALSFNRVSPTHDSPTKNRNTSPNSFSSINWTESQKSDLKLISKLETANSSSSYLSKYHKKNSNGTKLESAPKTQRINSTSNPISYNSQPPSANIDMDSIPVAKINLMDLLKSSNFLTSTDKSTGSELSSDKNQRKNHNAHIKTPIRKNSPKLEDQVQYIMIFIKLLSFIIGESRTHKYERFCTTSIEKRFIILYISFESKIQLLLTCKIKR